MNEAAVKLYEQVRHVHEIAVTVTEELKRLVNGNTLTLEELVDVGYALKECERYSDELERTCRQTRELAERLTCVKWVARGTIEPVRTKHVTGSPDVKLMPRLPSRKKDPENYARLMNHLKVPNEHWDVGADASAVVEPHWPGMLEYVAKRAEEGLPPPPGCSEETYPIYKCVYRAKKEVNAD